jgi:hypothetical protein
LFENDWKNVKLVISNSKISLENKNSVLIEILISDISGCFSLGSLGFEIHSKNKLYKILTNSEEEQQKLISFILNLIK